MPIHDWTRVSAGTFHDFHTAWISQLRTALNGGLLPDSYYALAEQVAGQVIPDVLTLQDVSGQDIGGGSPFGKGWEETGGIALADALPRTAIHDTIPESVLLTARARRLVIRHSTGDKIVAILEIVSPGNKERQGALENFLDKVVGALDEGFHLLLIDLFPPGPYDPEGIHGALWQRLKSNFVPIPKKPLTLASYTAAAPGVNAYVEPTAVRETLLSMPLFLDTGHYVEVPLEATYLGAYEGVPKRWKRVIEQAENGI